MTSHDVFAEDVAAYALDALDERDRVKFEAHLASCDRCQGELVDFRRVGAALGAAVEPLIPPASLRARTLAHATAQPQLVAQQVARATAAPATAVGKPSGPWLALAASLALVVGLGVYSALLRSQVVRLQAMVTEASVRAEALRAELATARRDSVRLMNAVQVFGAPDLVRVDLRGAAGAPRATGRAYVSGARGLVFSANQLPPLSPGRVYQLWVIPPQSEPLSAGIFSVDASGSAPAFAAALPAGAQQVKTVAVTEEQGPAGSPKPSTSILLVGSAGG